jgi:hypothetical protein
MAGERSPQGETLVLTVHRETASLCLAAETATKAAPQANMDVKANALTHAYVRKVRTCSYEGDQKTVMRTLASMFGT